jgi:regulator of protease activity HflC (stomatin/prohibitin superfamily)
MNKSLVKIIVGVVSVALIGIFIMVFCFKKNNATDWQHRQSISGEVTIQQTPGWYWSLGETINTWPKVMQDEYPVSFTFGDGGKADVNVLIRYSTPTSDDGCKTFHAEYRTPEAVQRSMQAWVNNVMKSTAGIMTASEHAVGRKSEYAQMVMDQVRDGLYEKETRNVSQTDPNDAEGKTITVVETELKLNEGGQPIIQRESAWNKYGVKILEVTLGRTKYDPQTLKSFEVKKGALLKIEEIKAQIREEQEKGRQMVIKARTLKETATAEGEAKEEQVRITAEAAKQKIKIEAEAKKLAAQELADLAIIDAKKEKEMAEISAEKEVEVAKLQAQAQLEIANAKLAVAEVEAKAAEEEAKGIKVLAEAEEERIQRAGAITEKEKVLAEIAAKRDAEVASHLKDIKTPTITIGGGNGTNGSNTTENLINLKLLESTGILDSKLPKLQSPKVQPTVKKTTK